MISKSDFKNLYANGAAAGYPDVNHCLCRAIHSCQLFVTKSDPNMALNIIISKEYTFRRILSIVCCYKNFLLL